MEKVARPFRVCLTGAESTGKSMLARHIATRFGAPLVPEYSREYAERVGRRLDSTDVAPIARGQIEQGDCIGVGDPPLVILDTDLLSTVVYSRHHFGSCPEWVVEAAKERRADLYLLLDVDVPWIPDPVRDTGDARTELHRSFHKALEEFGALYVVISGGWDERRRRAGEVITAASK